jgi:hypothetical protein
MFISIYYPLKNALLVGHSALDDLVNKLAVLIALILDDYDNLFVIRKKEKTSKNTVRHHHKK